MIYNTTYLKLMKINFIIKAKFQLPFSFPIKKDFPDPHLAYNPTEIGMDKEGSLNISAIEDEYKS